jgi:hypothetical protein
MTEPAVCLKKRIKEHVTMYCSKLIMFEGHLLWDVLTKERNAALVVKKL